MNRFTRIIMAALVALCIAAPAAADMNVPPKKQTTPGLYLTAAQAYDTWRANPETIRIIDVRTPEEYVFIGHAPMAVNIPVRLLNKAVDPNRMKPSMRENPDFEKDVSARYKKDDTLYVMCRSGGRSAHAVNRLAAAGFTKVYNIIDGFEGDKVADKGSCFDGKRMKNGWRNSGAPWTYALEKEKVHME